MGPLHKTSHPTEATYQRNDDFAVRRGLKVVLPVEFSSNQTVVVDLAVDGEDDGVVLVGEGLSTRF